MRYANMPMKARAWFAPGRGKALAQIFASSVGRAKEQIRLCSPLITSAPILASLAEAIDDNRCDVRIVIDGPMMQRALTQWERDQRAAWKAPLFERLVQAGVVHAKPSTPYGTGTVHDYMHAKLLVCDHVSFIGSYNCSHSGEFNAENVVELNSVPFAATCTAFIDEVYNRYPTY